MLDYTVTVTDRSHTLYICIYVTTLHQNTGDSGSYKKLTAGGTHDLMMAEEGNNGIQMSTIGGSPAWVADVESIEQCLSDIQGRMEQLQSMHATRVGSVFGRDLEDMEGRIEQLTNNLTDQFRFSERLLQKVGVATRRAGGEEATVGANIQRRLVFQSFHESCRFSVFVVKYSCVA